jgi:hypothetical protein
VDIMPKRDIPRRDDAFGDPAPGAECEITWIADRIADPFRPRAAQNGPCAVARVERDWLLIEDEVEETAPPHRVLVDMERRIRVIDAVSGRALHTVGEIRLVGRVWRFVLATRGNGFRAPLNSNMASRLAQLDGVPMGRPRTPDTLSAEISSLLGYDTHN